MRLDDFNVSSIKTANLGIHIKRKMLARTHLVFYKIKKVANIWITFKNSSDAMITSIITKKESEASAISDPPFWIVSMYSILLKARRNGGIVYHNLIWV